MNEHDQITSAESQPKVELIDPDERLRMGEEAASRIEEYFGKNQRRSSERMEAIRSMDELGRDTEIPENMGYMHAMVDTLKALGYTKSAEKMTDVLLGTAFLDVAMVKQRSLNRTWFQEILDKASALKSSLANK